MYKDVISFFFYRHQGADMDETPPQIQASFRQYGSRPLYALFSEKFPKRKKGKKERRRTKPDLLFRGKCCGCKCPQTGAAGAGAAAENPYRTVLRSGIAPGFTLAPLFCRFFVEFLLLFKLFRHSNALLFTGFSCI